MHASGKIKEISDTAYLFSVNQLKDLRYKVQTISAAMLLMYVLSMITYMVEMIIDLKTIDYGSSTETVRLTLIIIIQIPSALLLSSGSRINWIVGLAVSVVSATYQTTYLLMLVTAIHELPIWDFLRSIIALLGIIPYCLRPVRDYCLYRPNLNENRKMNSTATIALAISALAYPLTFFIPAFHYNYLGEDYSLFSLCTEFVDIREMVRMDFALMVSMLATSALMIIVLLCIRFKKVLRYETAISLPTLLSIVEAGSMYMLLHNWVFAGTVYSPRYGFFIMVAVNTIELIASVILMADLYLSERILLKEYIDSLRDDD